LEGGVHASELAKGMIYNYPRHPPPYLGVRVFHACSGLLIRILKLLNSVVMFSQASYVAICPRIIVQYKNKAHPLDKYFKVL
jgi:protein-S-isoprenylcysteine O-methyltransferase Ste14